MKLLQNQSGFEIASIKKRSKKMAKAKTAGKPGINLKKGKCYAHADLNIHYPETLKSYTIVDGEAFLFITVNNGKYQNELHSDGVVHQPTEEKYLVKGSGKDEKYKGTHILIRFHPKGDLVYEYIGDEQNAIRWDTTKNKIFVN